MINVPFATRQTDACMMRSSFRFVPLLFALFLGVLFAGGGTTDARAQSGMRSVGAVGSGGGTSALDTGPAVMYSNPANLTVGPATHNVEIQLLRVGTYVGGDLLQYNNYNTLFEEREKVLSDEREKEVLDDWFGSSQRSAATYVEVTPVAVAYRPDDAQWAMGMGLRSRTIQKTGTNRGLLDILLRGTNPGGTEGRTVPLDGRSRVYSTVDVRGSFSYRFPDWSLSVGVSPSFILGLAYSDMDFNSTVTIGDDDVVHKFDYTARAAGAASAVYDNFNAFESSPINTSTDDLTNSSGSVSGVGGGLDLGATYTVRPGLHTSVSITDLGLVRWSEDAQTVTPKHNEFRFGGLDSGDFNGDIGDRLETQLDSLSREVYQEVERDRSSFTTGLPTALHLNSTWDQGIVILNGGVSVSLNDAAGAVPDPLAVHLGSKLDAGPVPIRVGMRALGPQAFTFSSGFGLDVGTYNVEIGASFTPSTAALGSGARYAVSFSLGTIRI